VLDVRRKPGRTDEYALYHTNGTTPHDVCLEDHLVRMQEYGAGEIVLNSIDRDGTMEGYDLDLIDRIRPVTRVPLTVLGGCGGMQDIEALLRRYGNIGAAAGSQFVFKGRFRAVLIQYPNDVEKEQLVLRALAERARMR
jgi:cyclase